MADYIPVSCSLYDVLEASAVQRATVSLVLSGTNEVRHVRILDLYSKERQEFLTARDVSTGDELTLRLDEILQVIDRLTNRVYISDRC